MREGTKGIDIRLLSKAAGLMVPEPSIKSPPIPFIGAETGWDEPYITRQGRAGRTRAVAGPIARQRGVKTGTA